MSKIHIFDGNHHGSLLVKDGELFFNNGLEESAHEGQDGKGYRQLVDDCTAELARLAECNKDLQAVADAVKSAMKDGKERVEKNYAFTGGFMIDISEWRKIEEALKKAGYINV